MGKLIILNCILLVLIAVALILLKRLVKSDRGKRILLIVSAALTVLCHYSSVLYHAVKDGTGMQYLYSNPNLVLPIYPCNVVMWCCVILACLSKKERFYRFLVDYIFLFGLISALVGLFANVDFVRNPTLLDYDVTKGILAHAFMLFNIMVLPVFGFFKLDLIKNLPHIVISVVMMFAVGLYCNLVVNVVGSEEYAWQVNSMFILHSPFDGLSFLTYPVIAGVAIVAYFGILALAELFRYPKGERWISRLKKRS